MNSDVLYVLYISYVAVFFVRFIRTHQLQGVGLYFPVSTIQQRGVDEHHSIVVTTTTVNCGYHHHIATDCEFMFYSGVGW